MPLITDVFVRWVVSTLQFARPKLLYLYGVRLFVADFSFGIGYKYGLKQYFYPKVIDS